MTTEVYLGEKLLAPERLSELLRSQNDYLSQAQHRDTRGCFAVDNGRGSSAMDLTNTAQAFSVSTEVSEPSSAGNYDFSDNMSGQHFSQSDVTSGVVSTKDQSERNQNGRTGPIDFDCDPTTSLSYVINTSPRRWNFRKTKSRQNTETEKYTVDGLYAGKVSLDLDMMQITRKRRSCLSKRVRASAWGLLYNLELDFVKDSDPIINLTGPENPSRSRGQASRKQKNNQPKNHYLTDHEKPSRSSGQASGKKKENQPKGLSEVVRKKRSHRTIGISVKFKAGVGVGSGSIMDVSNEGPFEIIGKTPDLPKEDENLTNNIMSKSFKASDDTTHNVRKYVVENISNSGSDLGTSPDSEVINLNIDTSLWGNSEEEFHNLPGSSHICMTSDSVTCLAPKNSKETQKQIFKSGCSEGDRLMKSGIVDDIQSAELGEIVVDVPYSLNVSASSSSVFEPRNTSNIERKSKEQSASPVADIELPCAPSTDIETEVTPIVGLDLESPVLQVSAKVHLHSKGQNILEGRKKDRVTKSRSKINVSANTGRCDSRKKLNQHKLASKYKLKVKLRGGLISSEAEKQAGPGDSKLAVSGESGTAKSSLTGDELTFNDVPRAFAEQSKKPRNAWVLCDDCQKWRRIPATLADHLEETNCSWTCKDNVDKNFGNCSIPQEKSDAQINTELEISDASCDEGVWDARLNSNNLGDNRSTGTQRSTWKLIKSNQFLHRSQQTQTIDEIMVCHCKPPSDGRMGCGDGCLNRMLSIECTQGTCPCGELCSNQQFQKRNYARLKMFKCGKKGYGIQVLDNISEGQFLIEYVGEVLDMNSYEARQRDYAMQGHKHFYFMTLNGSEVIDARDKGNLGRFINHSCDPNCRTEKWMVNGEVCIGLFALKNIQKGEELTFDYNYVRVFGAAAKKCVCESSQCRGYIGGQSQNTEIVVQDDSEDEYPEPVMVCEDGAVDETYPDMTSLQSTFYCIGAMPEMRPKNDESVDVMSPQCFARSLQAVETGVSKKVVNITSVVEHEDTIEERVDHFTCGSTDLNGDTSKRTEDLRETLARCKVVSKQDDISSKTLVTGERESSKAGENVKQSCPTATLEENSANIVPNKLLPDAVDNKRKPKSGSRKQNIKYPVSKASRLTSLTNSQSTPVNVQKVQETQGKNDLLSCKSKKEVDISSTGHLEAVQEKLNKLLNLHGGISKRIDASKGYLKLLLLTAASGDSYNGEAIQSNRDLSMILGALLETKSRTVLVDIINKNGLQMLHNMLKRSRKEFNKIPILRKLLKVFEYLATLKILTSEHIRGGPTCPGVESFTESILSLTEHVDKQVHQIARSFRDRWIPRSARRHQREERVVDFCRSSVHKQWSNQAEKHLETPDDITKSVKMPTTFDTGIVEVSCQSTGIIARNTRKRKSRWDQSEDLNVTDDGMNSIDNDLPHGFAASCNPTVVPSEVCSYSSQRSITTDLNRTCQVVSGQPQLRFVSCLPVSYGVPIGLVDQLGMPHASTFEDLSVAPGMPFHPFPPLPPYPHNTGNSASNDVDSAVTCQPAHDRKRSVSYKSGPNPPIPQEATMLALERPGTIKELNVRQSRGSSTLGRKYYGQRKWNSSKLGPPWIRNRYNNLRNGMNHVGRFRGSR